MSPSGSQVNTSYDSMGRVSSKTNPFQSGGTPGPATTFQYDTLGRPTITTLPDGNTLRADHSGGSVTAIDQVGQKVKRESDGLGRLIKVTEQDQAGGLTQETTYSYNLLDKIVQVNQGNQGQATQYRYYKHDALGRLLYEWIPEQSAAINDGAGTLWSMKYTYTEFNAVLTKQDARGVIITYSYDSLHRVAGISYNTVNAPGVAETPPVSIYRNPDGSVNQVLVGGTSTTPNTYQETYSYDSFNRVQSVTRWILGQTNDPRNTYTTSYEYNGASQPTLITYPSGNQVSYSYDNQGRPSSVSGINSINYNTAGQVTGLTLGNGVVEGYGYDSQRLQMTSQTAAKNGNSLMNLTYSYQAAAGQMGTGSTAGNAGQLMAVNNNSTINGVAESASYTYDLVGRLVTSNQPSNGTSAQRRFQYDRWGNRTGVWDAVSAGMQIQAVTLQQSGGAPTNRIQSVSNNSASLTYAYDAAGNVTNDGAHTYQYDAENRVVKVDAGAATYHYDHQNRRICKIVASAWTHYIWEGNQVVAEHDGTTAYSYGDPTLGVRSAKVDYVYFGSRMILSNQWSHTTTCNKGVCTTSHTYTTKYYISDRLGVRLVTDAGGSVVGRQAHLPFGEDFAQSGAQEKHHFTSYERDAESGLDYAVNRSYLNSAGRFQQTDPVAGSLKDPKALNRYSYVQNNPVNGVDRDGLRIALLNCGSQAVAVGSEFAIRFICTISGADAGSSFVPPEPKIDHAACNSGLKDVLGKQKNNAVPNIAQVHQAMEVASVIGVDASLLLLLWWKESGFKERGSNNSGHYGPLQISRDVADTYAPLTPYSPNQALGNTRSATFTGDVIANLTVGAIYLRLQVERSGGDLGLAFVRYQIPAAASDHSNWGNWPGSELEDRYKKFQDLYSRFSWYTNCIKTADENLKGAQ